MNHEAEAHIQGGLQMEIKAGVHMSVSLNIVVPSSPSFAPPPKKLIVDSSKVTVNKG